MNERISQEDAEEILLGIISSIEEVKVTNGELGKLLKRCKKHKGDLFTYLQQEGMSPDNNPAERDLRAFAKKRRTSKDFKSIDVKKHLIEYLSLYLTCKVNGRDLNTIDIYYLRSFISS